MIFGMKQRRSIHGIMHLLRSRYQRNITPDKIQYPKKNFASVEARTKIL